MRTQTINAFAKLTTIFKLPTRLRRQIIITRSENKLKLAILGASVSAQARNHATGEITGYSEFPRESHAKSLGFSEIKKFAYGGNRASDAGLVKSLTLRDFCPDYCIFEPNIEDFSRGEDIVEEENLFIYRNIVDAGARPIALFLPDRTSLNPQTRPQYPLHERICKELGIPEISIDVRGVVEPTALFQDDLHTNVAGAAHYANVIATELAKICANYNWAEVKKDKMISNRRIVEVKMPKSERCLGIKVGINLTGSNTEVNVRIIQVQLIGTFSPIIRSTHADSSSERSIWDRYCHRDRPSFVMLFDGALKESSIIDITVSRKDPAYSRPRPDGLPWPDADNRYMTTLGKIYVIASDDIEAEVCS